MKRIRRVSDAGGGAILWHRCRSGVAAIEMAFIAPVLVGLALGMIDLGLGIYIKMLVADAADAGAAFARINGSAYGANTATAFNQAVENAAQSAVTLPSLLTNGGLTATASEEYCCAGMTDCDAATPPDCASGLTVGTYVEVETAATYATLLPYQIVSGFFDINFTNPVTLSAVSVVRIE